MLLFQVHRNGFIDFSDTPLSSYDTLENRDESIGGFSVFLVTKKGGSGYLGTAHESNSTDEISLKLFNETKTYLEKYVKVTDFSPKTIILGTWYKCSHNYYRDTVWLFIIVLYYVQSRVVPT